MTHRPHALLHHASQSVVLLLMLFWLAPPLSAATREIDYRIDPIASDAMFRVKVLWLDNVNGHFTRVDGDVAPGPQPDRWVVNATIPVDSVAMPSAHMRRWILSTRFFDAEHHPTIRFVSNPVALTGLDHGGTLTGYLTLRGITAPIQFVVEPTQCGRVAEEPCKILLRGNLQRSTFGMTSNRVALSDSVDLNLSITLQPQVR